MKPRHAVCAVLAAAPFTTLSASAGPLDQLKSALPGLSNSSGSAGAASALSGGSLLEHLGGDASSLGSPQNVAGILAFCQAHGWAPSASGMVKNKLMSKLGLQDPAQRNNDYKQGLAGVLQDGKGGSFDLSKLKNDVGMRACGMVADHAASSLLGG